MHQYSFPFDGRRTEERYYVDMSCFICLLSSDEAFGLFSLFDINFQFT